jgi:Uma2 family endonuclease
MDAFDIDILALLPVPRRRLTVAEYHRLGEAGILGEDDRVELLEGQLVQMSPIGPRHATIVDTLTELLVFAVAGRATVRVQNPVTLDRGSEPQPDIAILRRSPDYKKAHPGPGDVILLIEISDSSLGIDKGAKLAAYAKTGIREYWIVDLTTNLIDVHRQPSGLGYAAVTTVTPMEMLEIEALPGVSIAAAAAAPKAWMVGLRP